MPDPEQFVVPSPALPLPDGLRRQAIRLLDRALATELVCMFRHRRHYSLGKDVYPPEIARSLKDQADEESRHVDAIVERMVALGGVPDLAVSTLARRSCVPCDETADPEELAEMFLPALLEDDVVAERIAADAYREMLEDLAGADPATCSLLRQLAATEEIYAAGWSGWLRAT